MNNFRAMNQGLFRVILSPRIYTVLHTAVCTIVLCVASKLKDVIDCRRAPFFAKCLVLEADVSAVRSNILGSFLSSSHCKISVSSGFTTLVGFDPTAHNVQDTNTYLGLRAGCALPSARSSAFHHSTMTQQVFRVSRLSVVLLLSASGATGFVVRPAVTGQCRSGTTSSTAAGGTTTAAGPWDVGPTSSPHQSAIRRVKSPPLHPQQQGLCPSTTALGSSNVQTSEATPIAGSLHDERQQGISGAWVGEAGSLPPHFTSSPTIALVQHVLNSFEQEFDGQPLINGMDRGKLSKEEQARRMATAPFALVVHDHGCADDPIFIYGGYFVSLVFSYCNKAPDGHLSVQTIVCSTLFFIFQAAHGARFREILVATVCFPALPSFCQLVSALCTVR